MSELQTKADDELKTNDMKARTECYMVLQLYGHREYNYVVL